MWDTASYLAALVAAHELGLASRQELDERLGAIIRTFNAMSFFRDELPRTPVGKVRRRQLVDELLAAQPPDEPARKSPRPDGR